MTNDYMFCAVLQSKNNVLRGLVCSLLYLSETEVISVEITNPIILRESEFYAIHKLMNVKNYHIYSDNFTLGVVDLSRIDLATEEDKKYFIDYWAKLFKASNTIFQLSTDEQIRKQCRDREEYYQDLRTMRE